MSHINELEAVMRTTYIEINRRKIGSNFPVYVVAELSANHRQKYNEAVKLIKAAKDAGADAVKLQTYTPDTITIRSDAPEFRVSGGTPWDGKTLYELYNEAYTPWEWQPKLKKIADDLGIDLFSTPFDKTAVDFLEEMGVPAYKVASFELVDIPLIEYIASKGKPIIMSTGMATLDEIDEAMQCSTKSWSDADCPAQMHQRLPSPTRGHESAYNSSSGQEVRGAGWAFRPHPRDCCASGSGGIGSMHYRETLHSFKKRSQSR